MADTPNPFSAPTEFSDVVLVVEGKNLHVCKQFLGIHSPVFAAMLFGAFVEAEKKEVELKDVAYDEFLDVLKVIHPGWHQITATSVPYILRLADQFSIKEALDHCEKFLIETTTVPLAKKIALGDQYNLLNVTAKSLSACNNHNELRTIKESREFLHFSDVTKAAINARMAAIPVRREREPNRNAGPRSYVVGGSVYYNCTFPDDNGPRSFVGGSVFHNCIFNDARGPRGFAGGCVFHNCRFH